jgi:RNA polymerase-binding transcription factor DksA
MNIDTNHYKEKLENEKKVLIEELKERGRLNTTTNIWEAVPEEQVIGPEADENDLADRSEDYGERTAAVAELGRRLQLVELALNKIVEGKYGICEISGEEIEEERLEANPAAKTCIKHINQ